MTKNLPIFDNFAHTNGGRKKIQKVRVHEDKHICAVDVMYDGLWFPAERSKNYAEHVFELDDDEFLVKVTGRTVVDDYLGSICFHTCKGRVSPVYGSGAGSEDYSISLKGSAIAAFYGIDEHGSSLRQFGAIFVAGLVARVAISNITQHYQSKVEKLGNPYVIGRSLLKNKSAVEQQMSADLTHISSRSEVVTTGLPFSTDVHVSSYQSSPRGNTSVEGTVAGKHILSIMAKGEAVSAAKENVIHVAAKVPPKKVLTATAMASNLVVVVPYSADSIIYFAGSSKTKSVTLNGTYTSVSAQICVEYDEETDIASHP